MSQEHVVLPIRTNIIIYFALLLLLVLTVAIAYVDLGPAGLPIAMSIATVKAVLIMMYFMHVKFSKPLVWIFATAAFFWLAILLVFSLNDYISRGWIEVLGK